MPSTTIEQQRAQQDFERWVKAPTFLRPSLEMGMWEPAAPLPDDYRDLTASYVGNATAYSCIALIQRTCAKTKRKLVRSVRSSTRVKRTEIHDHDVLDLLRRPNPHMGWQLFAMTMMGHLESTGNAYIYIGDFVDGKPHELWLLPPDSVEVVPDEKKYVKHYVYTVNGVPIPYPDWQIIHVRYPSATSFFYGVGTLESLQAVMDLAGYAIRYNTKFFKQGGLPPLTAETDQSLPPETIRRLRREYNQSYGGVENSHKILFTDAGLKVRPLAITQKDMEFSGILQWAHDTTCNAFHIPPQMIPLLTHSGAQQFSEAHNESFLVNCIEPRLGMIAEVLTLRLVAFWDDTIELEFESVTREDERKQAEIDNIYLRAAAITINEWREQRGLEPVPWGDKPFNPNTMQGATPGEGGDTDGGAAPSDSQSERPPDEEGGRPEKTSKKVKRKAVDGDAAWKSYIERAERHERKLETAIKRWLQEQENAISRKVRERQNLDVDDFEEILPSDTDLCAGMFNAIVVVLTDIYLLSGQKFTDDVAPGQLFHLAPSVKDALEARLLSNTFAFSSQTRLDLINSLTAGINAGESKAQLSARVADVFREAKSYRTDRFAWTESQTAIHWAQYEVYREWGVAKVMWLSMRDEKVRDTHRAIDGEVVNLGEQFSNGLRFPHDPDGPADEVVNCRCDLLAVEDEE